ncbi:MAG TPA: TlyA family rRNA (cytidine-2'-O)-methyltransferase, partial [Acidimicrobiia bacterium]|nr:TlyA family rRNA (cytidine-2'-O)-methyltransferase [Acidimicrobiia bacterium]
AGRDHVGKGGIVRDRAVHTSVLQRVTAGLDAAGLGVIAAMPSPVRGADGNVEFMIHCRKGVEPIGSDQLDAVVETAHEAGAP